MDETDSSVGLNQYINNMDITSKIIAYECGDLNDMECIELFSELVKNGMAWSLQGHYGRAAKQLIDQRILHSDGNINHDRLDEVCFF
jgi:hypothetical protein